MKSKEDKVIDNKIKDIENNFNGFFKEIEDTAIDVLEIGKMKFLKQIMRASFKAGYLSRLEPKNVDWKKTLN